VKRRGGLLPLEGVSVAGRSCTSGLDENEVAAVTAVEERGVAVVTAVEEREEAAVAAFEVVSGESLDEADSNIAFT
tara:strand:+ start:424 stop:651 length:228 start_codon:yes stop_codon:yes gene_type:complete